MLSIIQNYDISSQQRDLLRDKEEYFLLCLKADLVVGKRDKLAVGVQSYSTKQTGICFEAQWKAKAGEELRPSTMVTMAPTT